MGLDIVLGLMVFVAALRGWFRGFVLQAIQLGGLVGSVYAAGPVREYARPYVVPYLTSIRPDLLDRMLWWASAVLSYLVTVGVANLLVKLYRKRPYGEPEPNRADQMAGFLAGAAKGFVVCAFLIAAMERYALTYVRNVPWAEEQARTSNALVWNQEYRPAERIWAATPVQTFVAQVRRMGLNGEVDRPESSVPRIEVVPASTPAQASTRRMPRLDLPNLTEVELDPTAPGFLDRFDQAVKTLDRIKP